MVIVQCRSNVGPGKDIVQPHSPRVLPPTHTLRSQMGLTRGASSAAANSPPNKKVKKVYNTNEQYDPTPMTSYAKRTGHPQVFDPVVPVYPEDCMYGKKGEPTQQMYNHVLGSVCNRLALRENFAECTLETQPDFKVCARVSWLPLTHMSLIAPTLQRRAATSHTRTTSRRASSR